MITMGRYSWTPIRGFTVVLLVDRSSESTPEPRVRHVTDRIAEEIAREHGQADGQRREEHGPRRRFESLGPGGHHAPPRGLVRRRPHPHKAERRFDDDRISDIDADQHDVRRERVGEDMQSYDAPL